jgi:hypothetical protein
MGHGDRHRPSHGVFPELTATRMQNFSAWLESTPTSKYLFDLPWLWPASESLHFIGLALLIGGAGFLDLRLLGMFRGVPIRDVKRFMPWAIAGFAINAITGMLFVVMQPHLYLGGGLWWTKMSFVGVAGLNALFFETRLSQQALVLGSDEDTPWSMKMVGGMSLASWFGVLYCGRMLPYLGTGN